MLSKIDSVVKCVAVALVMSQGAGVAMAQQVSTGGVNLPAPEQVPGKEYATRNDLAPLQTQLWGGSGSGLNYGPAAAQYGSEVDAMANSLDALYPALDAAYLLFNVGNEAPVRWEAPEVALAGLWGTPPNSTSTDALEVWAGENGTPDADKFSLQGDANGTSVFSYNLTSGTVTPWISQAEIAQAIGLNAAFINQVDVDGLVVYGSNIVFSIAPVDGFDGGEIWHWHLNEASASFLTHGGHLWNTQFNVMATYGLSSENVTVLEVVAVPEPDSHVLMFSGLALLGYVARRIKA